jgi:hypothetical protein
MWIMLLVQWNGHEPGEVLKINYPTGVDMVEKGIAVECEPPQGAIPKREKAVLGPYEQR